MRLPTVVYKATVATKFRKKSFELTLARGELVESSLTCVGSIYLINYQIITLY